MLPWFLLLIGLGANRISCYHIVAYLGIKASFVCIGILAKNRSSSRVLHSFFIIGWYDIDKSNSALLKEVKMMEPNKPADMPEESEEVYTPGQRVILQILRWGAWIAAFMAMVYVMHAR